MEIQFSELDEVLSDCTQLSEGEFLLYLSFLLDLFESSEVKGDNVCGDNEDV